MSRADSSQVQAGRKRVRGKKGGISLNSSVTTAEFREGLMFKLEPKRAGFRDMGGPRVCFWLRLDLKCKGLCETCVVLIRGVWDTPLFK